MKTYNLTIATPHGLHIRVAARIVELVRRTGAKVRLFDRENRQADGGSIISLMILGAEHGHPLRVEVEGRNEQAVAEGLAEIFGPFPKDGNFDQPYSATSVSSRA